MPHSPVIGSILGTAVGDALGLPYEGLSKKRGVRMLGEPTRYRFLFGRGMVSDDTEHTCMVAQALIVSAGNPEAFARAFAWRLRWWLLGLPAGVGFATLRACLRLWVGFSPDHSGVFSAGNGPAMRSALLGAAIPDLEMLKSLVRVSTRLTHTDPKAEYGAWAVALAAHLARNQQTIDPATYQTHLQATLPPEAAEFLALVGRATQASASGMSTVAFAESLGLRQGVSGYVYHTVPVALHAWLRYQHDLLAGLAEVIHCGGDTDTTAAIVGGIIGAGGGQEAIPRALLDRFIEWPRTVTWMEALGHTLERTLADGKPRQAPGLFPGAVFARNGVFFLTVVCHIFRRLLPPY